MLLFKLKTVCIEFLVDVLYGHVEVCVVVFGVDGEYPCWVEDAFEFVEQHCSIGDEMIDVVE